MAAVKWCLHRRFRELTATAVERTLQREIIKHEGVAQNLSKHLHVFFSALKGSYCATVKINTFKYLQYQQNRKFVNDTVTISIHHITASDTAAFSYMW
jgi:hypothetical protein